MMKRFLKTFTTAVLILSILLPVLAPYSYAAEADSSGLQNYHAMTMDQILASGEDLTWVMTGDSITHNGSWTQGMNSYTEWFEQYLYDIGRGDDAVINTAWGGADIQDFLFDGDTPGGNGTKADPGMGLVQFITKYNPDVVTIKLGMNNRSMTTNNFVRYYKMMLDGIYAEGRKNGKIPKIIILTPTPMSGETIYDQAQEDKDSCWRFQRCLKEIAEDYDLLFVDLMTAFTTEATVLGDDYRATFFVDPSDGGIHPNAAGHYLIYKTFSKVLGIYDESLPMYQYNYEDLKYAPLWVSDTGSVIMSDQGKDMDKTMPSVTTGANLLSYMDFDQVSGSFTGSADSCREMADSSLGEGALTLEEAKSMGKTYSLVFRAYLEKPPKENQCVLYLSGTGYENWNQALALGAPGTKNQVYYQMRVEGSGKVSGGGQITLTDAPEVVGKGWHTFAIVQTESQLQYYVDGVLSWTGDYKLDSDIGQLFAGSEAVYCRIGNYGSGASGYYLKGSFDYWALYDGALSPDEVAAFTAGGEAAATENWSAAFAENALWAVAGAEQMSGYQGSAVYRSLFRLLDNTVRNTGSSVQYHRDIRLLNAAAPGYTVSRLNADYEKLIGEHNAQVLLLLPEVNEVYATGYIHSPELVSLYKGAVEALVAQAKADGMTVILWTPLASGDDTVNGYLNDYAAAVRQIAAADSSILFFDANGIMNINMRSNTALKNNWFEEDMYISPLCALDLARAFFTKCQSGNVPTAVLGELSTHNLRTNADARTQRGPYLRDYIPFDTSVSGSQITVDVSRILAAYPGATNLWVAVLPEVGCGDYSDGIWNYYASVSGSTCTFEAPWSNPVITVYGVVNGYIYRFKDQTVAAMGGGWGAKPTAPATDLTALKVVGAPDIGFSADVTAYNVKLYQYQRHVQIVGTAAAGQTITVNGQTVRSGSRSQVITVGTSATVTVTANGKTYTLTLTRPQYPDIIITEVMQETTGTGYDMLEIYNASGRDLDLKDYSIGFKKDYNYASPQESGNLWPYYFAGNDTGFHATSSSGAQATQTGINPITLYSTYEPGGAKTEPESIPFPAGSTMVVWVRVRETEGLTYEDLIQNLTDKADTSNYDNKTLSVDGKAVVPTLQQLVVAEVPKGVSSAGLSVSTNYKYGYLENHGTFDTGSFVRSWLFVLDADSARHYHNAVTKTGDDIHTAALLSRVSTSRDLSTVLYYDRDRGMSVVKNAGALLGAPVTGYTSDQSGYMNLTTFGAIEYWQKPYDLGDATAPTAICKIADGKLILTLKDNSDVRYFELNLDLNQDGIFETVVKKDLVLESSAASEYGIAEAIGNYTYTYDLGDAKGVKAYGHVVDGNNNKTTFGSYGELTIALKDLDQATLQIQLFPPEDGTELESSYDIVDTAGNVVGTVSGKYLVGVVELSKDQTLTIKGLPDGTTYLISVEAPEELRNTESIMGTIAVGTPANVELWLVSEAPDDGPAGGGPIYPTDPAPTEPEETTESTKPGGPGLVEDMTFPSGPSYEDEEPDGTQPGVTGDEEPELPEDNSGTRLLLLILTILTGIAMIIVFVIILLKLRKNKN